MAFSVETQVAVNRLNKKVSFLQPVLEAISNSLEAGATDIDVEFSTDENVLEGMAPKINGFTIEDNGEGFTAKNRKAFTNLWTENKIALGCKGVGRLTWLRVFEKAKIHSVVSDDIVDIDYTTKFDGPNDIIVKKADKKVAVPKTTIVFECPTDKYYKLPKAKNEKTLDLRPEADIDKLYDAIEKNIMVKLALLKKEGRHFSISIKLDGKTKQITDDGLPELLVKNFEVKDKDANDYSFSLYYNFFNDERNQKYMHYCANGRAVKPFTENVSLGADLPNNASIIMLLTSPYLDARVNDERNEFTLPISDNKPSLHDPLSFAQINDILKNEVQQIVLEKYPEIEKSNEDVKQQAINEAPYLADFIKKDNSIIKNKTDVLKKAKAAFEEKKIKTNTRFATMLKKKKIDERVFNKAVEEVSAVALAELGEYMFYRKNIIDALNSAIKDPEKKEEYIHNIFMPMKTDADNGAGGNPAENERQYLSNLWLLDDKFMTYSYAASDKTINQIREAIEAKDNEKYKVQNRPDLIIFFNKDANESKDVIIAEIKGANADDNEKAKALTELPNNIQVVRKNIPNAKSIWGYIITTIDDNFEQTILNQDRYSPLFCAGDNTKAYYYYNKTLNAHLTIIDIRTIAADSAARNEMFLEILKK